jgi:hypothetical protein
MARRLAADLEARGIATWLGPRDVDPGSTWPEAIEQGLLSSTHAAILLSEGTLESGAVRQELQMAEMLQIDGKLSILPVLLETVTLPPWLKVVQYIDFRQSYGTGVAALVAAIGESKTPAEASPRKDKDVRVYRLCRGERLDHLAARFLGDSRDWRTLMDDNPHLDPLSPAPGTAVFLRSTGDDS